MRPIDLSLNYGYEVPPCSRTDLLRAADEVHELIGYNTKKPFPIMKLVERVFYKLYPDYVLEITDSAVLGDKLGETFPDQHLIRLREDVYIKAANDDPLARMTVAHEGSHLIWHEGVPLAMAQKTAIGLPPYRSSEWQANALAGAILMPRREIIHHPYGNRSH